MKSHRSGFSLVEIAVVVAVIGLVIGGVVVGQSMLRAASVQSVISDADRYRKAALLFQEKYRALPGDMATAETLWGSDSGCPSTTANVTKKTTTCNGNGDMMIARAASAEGVPSGSNYYEMLRFWQHLANAGLIEGKYTGAASSGVTPNWLQSDINLPKTAIASNGFSLFWAPPGVASGSSYTFSANYRHILTYGDMTARTVGYPANQPGITAAEALGLDTKIDDGKPGSGLVLSYKAGGTWPNCVSGSQPATATYLTSTSGNACALIFITGF